MSLTAAAAVEASLAVVAAREASVKAFAYLDGDRARTEAAAVDAGAHGALRGLVVGVKDNIETGDQPTEHGSPIYAGHRPERDAACVERLRDAGAVCLGKTVTAEFACYHPGPTTNPHRVTHTPGGSSMGSAAGVAAGMLDAALGTQTGGSVIRPASFCGVFGFKPTFGHVPREGVKLIAPSLDTVGVFARDAATLDAVRVVVTGDAPATARDVLRIGGLDVEHLDLAAPDALNAINDARHRAAAAGAETFDVSRPQLFNGLVAAQITVQAYETARSLRWEFEHHRPELSDHLVGLIESGWATEDRVYEDAVAHAAAARASIDELFAGADVLMSPAALGEAPEGLASTGDPVFARVWTLLGLPSLSVPGLVGATGLPIGVQLIGRPGADGLLVAAGAWLHATISG